MSRKTDFLGDPVPAGYKGWSCDQCTAVCNFEAMHLCRKRYDGDDSPCGFERDQPESNGGHYGFMIKEENETH